MTAQSSTHERSTFGTASPSQTDPIKNKSYSRTAFTTGEFCARNGISKTTYYKLKQRGLGPKEMHLGNAIRISVMAEMEWQTARENPGVEEAEQIARKKAMRVEKAQRAGAAASASPRHVSKRRRGGVI